MLRNGVCSTTFNASNRRVAILVSVNTNYQLGVLVCLAHPAGTTYEITLPNSLRSTTYQFAVCSFRRRCLNPTSFRVSSAPGRMDVYPIPSKDSIADGTGSCIDSATLYDLSGALYSSFIVSKHALRSDKATPLGLLIWLSAMMPTLGLFAGPQGWLYCQILGWFISAISLGLLNRIAATPNNKPLSAAPTEKSQ